MTICEITKHECSECSPCCGSRLDEIRAKYPAERPETLNYAKMREELLSVVAERDALQARAEAAEAELEQYREAKAEGRLVALPCKVGTTIYRVYNTKGCSNCQNLRFRCDGYSCPSPRIVTGSFEYSHLQCPDDIFLTCAEAEAALAAERE